MRAAATSRQDLVLSRTGPGNSDSLSPSAAQLLNFRWIYLWSHPTNRTIVVLLMLLPVCRRRLEVGRYCKAGQGCLGRLLGPQHFQFGGYLPEWGTCFICQSKFAMKIKHCTNFQSTLSGLRTQQGSSGLKKTAGSSFSARNNSPES